MNKRILCMVTMACLLIICLAASAETVTPQQEEGYVYLASVSGAFSRYGEDDADYEKDMVYVHLREEGSVWLVFPEGAAPVETYHQQAVRFVMAEPLVDALDYDMEIHPLRVELLGYITGEAIALEEDYIETYVYDWGAVVDDAPTMRLTIDAESVVDEGIQPGDSLSIIYDADTNVVLQLLGTNG